MVDTLLGWIVTSFQLSQMSFFPKAPQRPPCHVFQSAHSDGAFPVSKPRARSTWEAY